MPKRQYPHLQDISDHSTRMSIQKNWDETYNQKDTISSLQAQVTALQTTVSSLQASITKLQDQMTQSIIKSGQ